MDPESAGRGQRAGVPADLASVAADVCGIQAQVFTAAEVALWTRRHSLTRGEIHDALWRDRTLVKTSAMRGTLHLLAAADFPIYINALRRSRAQQLRQIMKRYGINPKEADAVMHAVVAALRGGPLTRSQLTGHVVSLGIVGRKARKWFELSWWGVVRPAIREGLICYGPDRGPEATFFRVDQWLPEHKSFPEIEAKQILLRKYLAAYGPVTLQDFSRWTGISVQESRPVWESLRDETVEVTVERTQGTSRETMAATLLRKDLQPLANTRPREKTIRLLPSFDPFLLGHVGKNHLVEAAFHKRVYRKAGWISPVVLLNGHAIGTWSSARHGKRLNLEISLFGKISKTIQKKIEAEAAGLRGFK